MLVSGLVYASQLGLDVRTLFSIVGNNALPKKEALTNDTSGMRKVCALQSALQSVMTFVHDMRVAYKHYSNKY